MMELLSHPFRLETSGNIATVTDDTDQAYAEGLAVLLLTRVGERVLVPGFGTADATFDEVSITEINAALADYGPPIQVTDIDITNPTDSTEAVTLAFATTDDADDDED